MKSIYTSENKQIKSSNIRILIYLKDNTIIKDSFSCTKKLEYKNITNVCIQNLDTLEKHFISNQLSDCVTEYSIVVTKDYSMLLKTDKTEHRTLTKYIKYFSDCRIEKGTLDE